jgi:hypothetical protein
MRAGLGALEGRSLPWLIAEAPSIEVAADFTGIYRILMSKDCAEVKTVRFAVTKVPLEVHVRCWFGKKTFGKKTFGTKTRQISSSTTMHYAPRVSLLLLRVIKS